MCHAQGSQCNDTDEARTRGPSVSSQAQVLQGFICLIITITMYSTCIIRESTPQFENRIMAREHVRSIVPKSSILLASTGVWKFSSVACGFTSYLKNRLLYSDYPKSLISRINEDMFFNKIWLKRYFIENINFILLQSHLLLCLHGFCDVSVTLYNVNVTL